jgi:hypothetical protein
LLAGTVSQEEFFKAHGFVKSAENRHALNAFQDAVLNGRLIGNVSFERVENADDDWISFEFGDPDPAVAPFHLPTAAGKKSS